MGGAHSRAGLQPPTGVALPAVWRRIRLSSGRAGRPQPSALVSATPFFQGCSLVSTTERA